MVPQRFLRALAGAFLAIFSINVAHAIPEAGYQEQFEKEVLPFFLERGRAGHFTGAEGVRIAYRVFDRGTDSKGALVVVPGRTESAAKYAEVIQELFQAGYSVYIMDHRGQGYSQRMTRDPHKGYVRKFSHYVQDLDQFIRKAVKPTTHDKAYLLAHSMGAAISTMYLKEHPAVFHAVALNAPMYMINTEPYSQLMAHSIVSSANSIGLGKSYAIGKGPYDPNWAFKGNDLTHSEARFQMHKNVIIKFPELALGGPTNRWIKESMEEIKEIGRYERGELKTPMLMFQAGQDTVVMNEDQDQVCSRALSCEKIRYAGARHEVLMETDEIRSDAISRVLRFFAAH